MCTAVLSNSAGLTQRGTAALLLQETLLVCVH